MTPLLLPLMGPVGRFAVAGLVALAVAGALVGVGIRYERAEVLVAVARAEKAEAAAKALAATAQANADAAAQLARDNETQALAYAADAEQARSDADQIDLARQAAAIAARNCAPAAIHGALQDAPRWVSEDDELAPSMRAAMDALRAKPKRRHR